MKKKLFFFLVFCSFFVSYFSILFDYDSNFHSKTLDIHSTAFNKSRARVSPMFDGKKYISLNTNHHRSEFTGKNITVAVFDTGIYANHSVFTNNGTFDWNQRILAFYDDKFEDTTSNPYDISWHGTWTTSILGGNNSFYQGVAPGVNFVILKIFNTESDELASKPSIIEDAVDWIIDHRNKYKIEIASMSFGATYEDNPEETKELNEIVEELVKEDILVVAPTGNYGSSSGSVTSPGSAPSVLTVGGVDYDNEIYARSGRGPTFENLVKPDVCALSVDVLGADANSGVDQYETHSGTSASTPFVSGLAALMLEKNNNLEALQLKNIISLTSYRTLDPYTIKDNVQGWGVVQGYAALEALDSSIEIEESFELDLSLTKNEPVFCQSIKFPSANHYFFELIQEEKAQAEMYIFDSNPDSYGNPNLLSTTIDFIELGIKSNKMGLFARKDYEYFLVVKLIEGTGGGNFRIQLILDYRLGVVFIFFSINILSIIYLGKKYYLQKLEKT